MKLDELLNYGLFQKLEEDSADEERKNFEREKLRKYQPGEDWCNVQSFNSSYKAQDRLAKSLMVFNAENATAKKLHFFTLLTEKNSPVYLNTD